MARGQGPVPARQARPPQRSWFAQERPLPAVLFVAAVLAVFSPWRPGGSSDGIAVFRTAASLAFEGTFVLPKAPPGARLDPFYFPPSPDGSGVVSVYSPLGAFIDAGVLVLSGAIPGPGARGRFADAVLALQPILATALAAFPLVRLLRLGGARRRAAPFLAVALLVATFLGPLGTSDFQEAWLVLLASLALERALVSRLRRDRGRVASLAASGAAFAFAVLAKPTALALLPCLALPACTPRRGEPRARGLLALLLGAAPGVALLLSLNGARFGAPWHFGYGVQLAHPLARRVSAAFTVLRLTLLPNRGLFWYAPLLLLAPFRAVWLLLDGRRRVVAVTSSLAFGVFFAANVTWFAWDGGFGWGPRLLAPAVACAAPLLGARGSTLRFAAFLSVVGALLNLPGYLLEPGRSYRIAAAAATAEPLGPIVPIHRRDRGQGGLEPHQRAHYVPALAPILVAPGILRQLLDAGDGPAAGGSDATRTHDAWLVRVLLGQPRREGSETGALLMVEAWVTAGSDPKRAERMAARAAAFGGTGPR